MQRYLAARPATAPVLWTCFNVERELDNAEAADRCAAQLRSGFRGSAELAQLEEQTEARWPIATTTERAGARRRRPRNVGADAAQCPARPRSDARAALDRAAYRSEAAAGARRESLRADRRARVHQRLSEAVRARGSGSTCATLLALYYKQTTLADVQIQPSRTIKLRDERQITSWILAADRAADGRRRSRGVVVERRQLRLDAVDAQHTGAGARGRGDRPGAAAAAAAVTGAADSAGVAAARRPGCRGAGSSRRTDAPASASAPPVAAGCGRDCPPTTSTTAGPRPVVAIPLEFSFEEESWAEVTDARGERLLFGLNAAGRRLTVRGEPPFAVVLGDADAVRLTVDGEPYSIPTTGRARQTSRGSPSTSPRSRSAMAELIQPVKGMNDVLADQSAIVGPARAGRRRAVRELRLSARALARARAHGALQALDRRAHRHRLEGDVHLRRLRRQPHAAARGDRRRRARRA